ncbi:hypothetical protein, partial [Salinicola sp. MIT1003]|uniref:hypothetical protein n=1 Tax=Salinicola sp. MIT1003 TaxID=1882734 RepID=UPI001B355917
RRGAQEISRWTEHPSIALRLELETAMLEIYKRIGSQVILTSTLKDEEYSNDKYSKIGGVNAVNYSHHQDCKILNKQYARDFSTLIAGFEGIIL